MKHPLAVHHLLIAFFTLFLAACGGGGGGGSSSAGATAAVGPSVSITAVNPQTPVAGQVVAFTASGSGTGLSYAWNFGDNSVAGTGASVNHTYDHGSYTVTVTVHGGGIEGAGGGEHWQHCAGHAAGGAAGDVYRHGQRPGGGDV